MHPPWWPCLPGLLLMLGVPSLTTEGHGCFSHERGGLFYCLGSKVHKLPMVYPKNITYMEIRLTQLRIIPARAFSALQELNRIVLSENGVLAEIGPQAFSSLANIIDITISNSRHLVSIHAGAFSNLTKLKYLTITNTGLTGLPDFSRISSSAHNFLLEIQDNVNIEVIPPNAFLGLCTDTIEELRLTKNGIFEVQQHAFNGTKMVKLYLNGNQMLKHIHSDAFKGAKGPQVLDISRTALSALPESMLYSLKLLTAVYVQEFKKLPRLELLTHLEEANFTYPSHCCAFSHFKNYTSRENFMCTLPHIKQDEPHFYRDHCWKETEVLCLPKPDAFNPCEDIMGFTSLRVLIWVISMLAIAGNLSVLAVLVSSRCKLTVPRFLMCHLAIADLCMGVYMVLIAGADENTRSQYYNHAIDWQTGPGCRAAGFFTVLASELSVYTLTAITVERWHTITFAMRLDRKLRLRHACCVMAAGWLFALLVALLPMVGVSSYSKVSICLPMDVEDVHSQAYVVVLLLVNVGAFLVVCVCYLSIYMTVHNPSFVSASADTRIAKRMAVLIFTDFLCMAPISFFAISAALKWPLITVSHAKVLLVLFYPINSCANPFLYAFFTKTFKRDFFILASQFGFFKAQAQMYRTETSSAPNGGWVPTP